MKNPKNLFYLLSFLCSFVGAVSCNNNHNSIAAITKPNIILILSDDQGWGDLSIQGNTNLNTPNIDGIGKAGVVFDRFYVSPVCSPTRAEILTGRYHPRGGVYSTSAGGERLDLDETTIAEILQKAGYKTAAYGKWHNGMQYPYHPNARGFDDFYGFCSGHWGNYYSPPLEHNGQIVKGNGFMIDDFTEHAMGFIEDNQEDPFFVYLPYNTPHSPMQVPDKWWDTFKEKDLEKKHRESDKEKIQHTKAALAMCENIDWNVGRLIDKVKELGLEDNTVIIYLSDNGPNGNRWNGGMKGRKGSTDEGGVRSPLMIQWPAAIDAGRNISEIASAIDLLPTLVDLADVSYDSEKPIDGKSLSPLLLNSGEIWEDRLVYNHWSGRTSIRSQKYRLDYQNKLFDMISDPGQYKDISDEYPEIRDQLIEAKKYWEEDVLTERPKVDTRTFPVGHLDFKFTQIPARDGKTTGNIKRSNRYPNCSFFYNWTSVEDKISWEVEVVESGEFDAVIYYTCKPENVGASFELRMNNNAVTGEIAEAHDPPLTGMENDRSKRIESYVKDFKPLNIGSIHLDKGIGTLTLQALNIPGSEVMDFRLMMLERK